MTGGRKKKSKTIDDTQSKKTYDINELHQRQVRRSNAAPEM